MNECIYIKPTKETLASLLPGYSVGVYESAGSTNTELILKIKSGDNTPSVAVAVSQTRGHGRFGREFSSNPGGAYFSFSFMMKSEEFPSLRYVTPAAGAAVVSATQKLYGVMTGLKWVNDIILDGKKLGGILSESVTCGDSIGVVVGIGINVCNEGIPPAASRLCEYVREDPKKIDISEYIAAVIGEFDSRREAMISGDIIAEYRKNLVMLGKTVAVHTFDGGDDYDAEAINVDALGRLVIGKNGVRKAIESGEVSIKIK